MAKTATLKPKTKLRKEKVAKRNKRVLSNSKVRRLKATGTFK